MATKQQDIKSKVSQLAIELANGKSRKDLLATYGEMWQHSPRTMDRYLKDAQDEADTIRQETKNAIMDANMMEVKKGFKGRIISKLEKQDKLRQIIEGTLLAPKVIIIKGQAKTIQVKPDHQDIMKAMDIDNKMQGDYAPLNSSVTVTDGVPIENWLNANTNKS